MTGAEVAQVVAQFPDARTLGRALQDGVNASLLRLHSERGKVTRPEDVYATVQWMKETAENLTEYGRAFAAAAKLIDQCAEDELIEAVGEQDGVPLANLTVPAPGGDVTLTRDTPNAYDIDADALMAAIAAELFGDDEAAANSAITAMRRLVALGKFEPQISKVKALVAELHRAGMGNVAASVSDAIRKTTVYKGTKLGRKAA